MITEILRALLTIAMLLHASIKDIKTREIEPKYWIFYGVPLIVIAIAELLASSPSKMLLTVYVISIIAVIAMTIPLFLANMFGGADVFALLVIALSHPTVPFKSNTVFPVSIIVLLYSLLLLIGLPIAFFLYNLVKRNYLTLNKISLPRKIAAMFLGIPIRAGELINKRFWYPLYRPWSNEFKLSFDIEEDDAELREKIRDLIEKGELSSHEPIWSTYGIPTIPFILVGYLLTLITGDALIKLLFNSL
uniref:A24 family peptidase n=1 Tax=Fervidicoccus fontis TaxID=683846 RepID=A0A7C1E1G2_9CREN